MLTCEQIFLQFSITKLCQHAARIHACLDLLDEQQVWRRESEASNSVANLCLHLEGNVRQWIVHGVGGAPDVRQRGAEFAARGGLAKSQLWENLHRTVQQACDVLERLPKESLLTRVRPQNYEVTVLEAIYHVVEHFGQHTGQILAAAKAMTGRDLGFYRHLSGAGAPPPPPVGQETP